MFFITGDTHGDFSRIMHFARNMDLNGNDTIIILGDAGFNYYLDERDRARKQFVNALGCRIFSIHGNHEERPFNISSYKAKQWRGGVVWYETEFPNLLFAKDGELFDFNGDGHLTVVLGGAYSVDKAYRLRNGLRWFSQEQPSMEIKRYAEKQLDEIAGWRVDFVLSHTCPLRHEPIECYLPMIDQSTVDTSTEEWLDRIEEELTFKKWYCGHWHTSKRDGKFQFMYTDFDALGTK